MGSQCARPSPGTPTRGLLIRVGSAVREPGYREAQSPVVSSNGSPYEESDCDSIGSGPVTSSDSNSSNGVVPLEPLSPWIFKDSYFSAPLWHAPNRVGRSSETTSGVSSPKCRRTKSRLLTHSLPDRIDPEDARSRLPLELPSRDASAAVASSRLQCAAHPNCKPLGPCSRQSDDFVSAANPPTPDPQTKLDEATKRMFLDFYHRNRKEQRRHEEVLKAASRVVDRSIESCPPFVSAVSLEAIQDQNPQSPVPADALARQEAEALAVEALDVFSPDEKYTRLDEFLALVNAIQNEYQSERHRGRAVRGPNRASTFGALRTPPEGD